MRPPKRSSSRPAFSAATSAGAKSGVPDERRCRTAKPLLKTGANMIIGQRRTEEREPRHDRSNPSRRGSGAAGRKRRERGRGLQAQGPEQEGLQDHLGDRIAAEQDARLPHPGGMGRTAPPDQGQDREYPEQPPLEYLTTAPIRPMRAAAPISGMIG